MRILPFRDIFLFLILISSLILATKNTGQNELSGTIPSELGELSNLTDASLRKLMSDCCL